MTAAAVLILPAAASAAVTPTLTVSPTTTNAGTSPATVNFHATFSGGSPNDVIFALPAGLLANANQAGGACLISTSQTAACQIGSGMATAAGTAMPVSLYLVPGPSPSDAAGIALAEGSNTLSTAGVIVRSTDGGLNIAFSNLAAYAISDLNVNFTTLRLPTSCPTQPANVTLTADGTSTTAPLSVTGCSGLPYNPMLTATETKDAKDNGATLAFSVTQAADEAATNSIALRLPSGLGVNLNADLTCLPGTGAGCPVGTASATSPLVPDAALANGKVVLGGSASNPTITITFLGPFALTLVGHVSVAGGSVTFDNMPDLTLTSLNLNITGPNGQKAFTTKCEQSSTSGTFTSQAGVPKTVTGTVKLVNCGKPTATGSLSGLATGHPGLHFTVAHGKGDPDVSSISVGLPGGLQFSRAGIVTSKTCTTKGGKKKCTTTTLTKGLGIKGGTASSVALKRGKLLITLKKAVGKLTITLSGPVLAETSSLQTKVKNHKTKSLTVTLKVTDGNNTARSVPLKLKAH